MVNRRGNYVPSLVGQRFSRLQVLERTPNLYKNLAAWLCRCDCGAITVVPGTSLRSGATKSCGCLMREKAREQRRLNPAQARKYPPGEVKTRLYYVWAVMKSRCSDPSMKAYRWYGAKGVTVCDAWQDWPPFRDWAKANGYRQGLTIERVDVYGNYEPANCAWIPMSEQHLNKRAKEIKPSAP